MSEGSGSETPSQELDGEAVEHSAEQDNSVEQEGAHEEVSEAPDSELFTVTVDGQEQQVPRDELVKGWQRQSDYTRKTQELAAERDQLKAADAIRQRLLTDPQGTVRELQEWAEQQAGEVEDEQELDPEEVRLREVESFIESQRERELQSEIDGVVSRLKSEHGEFDQQELLAFAVERKIPDLEAALLLKQKYDTKSASDQEATEAKRQAAAVHSGTKAQGSTTKGPSKVNSMEDAVAAAKAELGVSDLTSLL